MANFICAPDVFKFLENAYDSGRPSIDFVNFIDELIRDGHRVSLFELTGEYVNLNDVASLEAAMRTIQGTARSMGLDVEEG